MYQIELKESYFPAQPGKALLTESIGETLRLASLDSTEKTALAELREDGSMGQQWTYGQLYELAEALAFRLAARYEKGTRIAVCAPNIPQWVILEYAAALAGLVIVTVNPSFQTAEMSYIIGQSGAVALFHVKSCRGNPVGKIAAEVKAEQSGLRDLVDMQDDQAFFAESKPVAQSLPEVKATDTVQVQYTSGTTGFPKGAVLHHRGLLNNGMLVGDRMQIDENSTYLNMMPMFHTGGCGLGTLAALAVRGRVILAAQFNAQLINAVIEEEQVTCFLAVPTMLVAILEDLAQSSRRQESVKSIIAGGAMVAPNLVTQAMEQWGCAVQVIYGQTEASPAVTQTWRDDSLEDLSGTVGQPLPHTEIGILHSSTNEIQPLDTVGEICARAYAVMHGYNDNLEATAAAIDDAAWLHTGDLGTMDARGFVRVTGRVKEMIIRGGENLFPAEIENAMATHPQIAEVAVVGISDPKWGEVVCCFLRPEKIETQFTSTDLVDYSRSVLSAQKTPTHWVAVNEWPLTASGKIQKFKLQEQFEQGLHQPI